METDAARTTANSSANAQTAPVREDAVFAQGWLEGVRAASTAIRATRGASKADEYFEGWLDAATLQPIDPIRLAETKTRYSRGYAAGAKQYELAVGAGYDAE